MGSERFDWERDSPRNVRCGKCREANIAATAACKLSLVGTVDHLYLCHVCGWGTTVRYLRANHGGKWIATNVISPGKRGLGYAIPKLRKGK